MLDGLDRINHKPLSTARNLLSSFFFVDHTIAARRKERKAIDWLVSTHATIRWNLIGSWRTIWH